MRVRVRTGMSLAAFGFTALVCACAGNDQAAAPSPASVGALASLQAPDTGRVVEHLKQRNGAWVGTVGVAGDDGALDISVSCVGGGELTLAYGEEASQKATASVPCQGSITRNRDEDIARGPVRVEVKAGGAQQWSVLIVRGMRLAD